LSQLRQTALRYILFMVGISLHSRKAERFFPIR
jgi:hypothetical protein